MERGHPCPQSVRCTLNQVALHAGRDARAPSRGLFKTGRSFLQDGELSFERNSNLSEQSVVE